MIKHRLLYFPSSGGGTGTPITGGGSASTIAPSATPRSCITLARYAQLTGYSECALLGINHPSEAHGDCENPIWDQWQREMLLYYLSEAQAEIESVTRYPLCPTYFTAEEHPYRFPIHTRWGHVLAVGQRAETVLGEDVGVNYATDPAVIGPVATSATDSDEIRIFYPDSDREIESSSVVIASDQATIQVPKCRLVHPDFFATPDGGLEYSDDDNFIAAVDVKRIYTDDSTQADLVWLHRSSEGDCPNCGCLRCGEHTETACLTIHNSITGALGGLRANYSDGAWTPHCHRCFSSYANSIRVYYLAGLAQTDFVAENAVLRLAHAKMPQSPCGCDVLRSLWARDTRIPEVLTRERENNPFGMSDGAWVAWKFANAIALRKMSVFG